MARVPYRDPDELPEESRHLLFLPNAVERTGNVFRAIANNPPVLDSFRKYFGVLWNEAGLSVRERQLAILATARATGAAYMWHRHVPLSRDAGLTDAEIRSVNAGEFDRFDGREPLLLRYAAAVARDGVHDDLHDEAAGGFDAGTVVGIAMLASGYVGVARVLEALDVELEDGFVGWDLEGT